MALLAEQGAEVVRIGRKGDVLSALDRSKRSVVLDLDSDDGKAAFRALVMMADVVAEDVRPTAIETMDLAAANPALVRAIFRDMDNEDASDTAMAFAIMAALRQAASTGRGQVVDMSAGDGPALAVSDVGRPLAGDIPQLGEHTDRYLAEALPIPTADADRRALRDAFGCFATGVTVVTTRQDDGTPRGFTANSFTSVSLDPPLLLVCVAKSAHSAPVFGTAPHFAVNILSQDQKDLSGLFASRAADKFERAAWHPGVAGMPVFEEALAHLVCTRERSIDAGDHIILLGRVIGHATHPGQPLGYFRGTYFSTDVEQGLIDAASEGGKIAIGALIADGKSLLLAKAPGGGWEVPKAPGNSPDSDALTARFRQSGLSVELDFLYAVYRDSTIGRNCIFYHGTATGEPPQGHRFHPVDALPLTTIRNAAERSMLTRYAAEHREGSFGIYQGDETRGTVHRIASREPSTY